MVNEKNNDNDDFLIKQISEELEQQPFSRKMCTRFPPEPNGYLHIGSAYAIHTNFAIAKMFDGAFHLRFDDTNPLKEDIKYVDSIIEDIKWLGYDPANHIYYGSDYSQQIYDAAVQLIKKGKAYVCDLAPEEVKLFRGTLTEPGKDSPYRSRSVEENLLLFDQMKKGHFPASSKVLRAKIDMSSPNMNMRDPVIYRIIYAEHYRTGNAWCIYPMYDFAHPIQDAIEGITYSLCSIEFKGHRPLYEWVLNELGYTSPPRQREFGRLNITGVVTSKRFLRQLVEEGVVDGWDDPRLPTIQGLRRRGFTPESIRSFIKAIGSIRYESTVDSSLLEQCVRRDLKDKTVNVMAVLQPLKVVINNYPADQVEWLTVDNNNENETLGTREVPFSKTIYIEREDFIEQAPKGFHRLSLNSEVRLKGAYFIRCEEVIKDQATGEILELRCTYDPQTKSGSGFTGRKVKGTIHWVSAEHAVKANVHLYNPLLLEEKHIDWDNGDWKNQLNPASFIALEDVLIEPAIKNAGQHVQFYRHGYFCVDRKQSSEKRLVLNRTVALKDTWNKK